MSLTEIERTDRVWTSLNRTMCGVLDEARKCFETRNFAPLLGLLEEIQSMGNRMEAALEDTKDYEKMKIGKKKVKKELELLFTERDRLRKEIGKLAER